MRAAYYNEVVSEKKVVVEASEYECTAVRQTRRVKIRDDVKGLNEADATDVY